MRILLSCLQSLKPHRIPAFDYWRNYFVEGLRELGHTILEAPDVDWAEALTYSAQHDLEIWRARTWESVLSFFLREHAKQPIDLFLGYLYPQHVVPSAIDEIQRRGTPCVNYFCDNVREFSKVPDVYRPFALHWVPEFEALDLYQRAGFPHIHAPMPCWIPADLRSLPKTETNPPTFIGSPDVLRIDLLGRALSAGADFFVRGRGWSQFGESVSESPVCGSKMEALRNQISYLKRRGITSLLCKVADRFHPLVPSPFDKSKIGPPVSSEEYVAITRQSTVTIGINRVVSVRSTSRRPAKYSRLRDIEAPMMGACYLTEWTAGLERMYEIGRDIECYRSPEELATKLSELRQDSARRQSMRQRAQRRALTEHTISRTIERISSALALTSPK